MNDPARAVAALPEATAGLVIAYSGGRDSTALLHALAAAGHNVPVRAVHVCHHLERHAEAWAAHCARWCAVRDIGFTRADVAVETCDGGLEAAARERRYDALACEMAENEVLVCAHHALDQAETFLLQALRGAGVAGLAAMPELVPFGPGRLWRPWLGLERGAITAYAETHGLDWIEDESNRDARRARGFIRHHIWPALAERWPAAASTLSRSAGWAAEAAAAVEALAEIDLESARGADDTLAVSALGRLSAARAGQVLRLWLGERGLDRPDHRHINQILGLLDAREQAGPRITFEHSEVRRFDGRLFALSRLAQPPAPNTCLAWPAAQGLTLPGSGLIRVDGEPPPAWPPDLKVQFRRGGERLARTDGITLPLAEWLRLQRIPPWIRERLPLIYAGATLIAIPGRWRHPALADWFGGCQPDLLWEHALPGDPVKSVVQRIVERKTFG